MITDIISIILTLASIALSIPAFYNQYREKVSRNKALNMIWAELEPYIAGIEEAVRRFSASLYACILEAFIYDNPNRYEKEVVPKAVAALNDFLKTVHANIERIHEILVRHRDTLGRILDHDRKVLLDDFLGLVEGGRIKWSTLMPHVGDIAMRDAQQMLFDTIKYGVRNIDVLSRELLEHLKIADAELYRTINSIVSTKEIKRVEKIVSRKLKELGKELSKLRE